MRKNKSFLCVFLIFMGLEQAAWSADAPVVPRTLDEFNANNPKSDTIQPEEYWQMAWTAKMADYGDADSQFLIAKAYENGTYTDVNPQKAVAFYKKAAQQGHDEACMALGRIYSEQKWLQRDTDQALFWYAQSAKGNYVPAMMKLAELYEQGEKPDVKESYYWLAKTTLILFPNEKDLTAHAPHLHELAAKLTPDDLAELQERLAL